MQHRPSPCHSLYSPFVLYVKPYSQFIPFGSNKLACRVNVEGKALPMETRHRRIRLTLKLATALALADGFGALVIRFMIRPPIWFYAIFVLVFCVGMIPSLFPHWANERCKDWLEKDDDIPWDQYM
jgi:hypothetical protein